MFSKSFFQFSNLIKFICEHFNVEEVNNIFFFQQVALNKNLCVIFVKVGN